VLCTALRANCSYGHDCSIEEHPHWSSTSITRRSSTELLPHADKHRQKIRHFYFWLHTRRAVWRQTSFPAITCPSLLQGARCLPECCRCLPVDNALAPAGPPTTLNSSTRSSAITNCRSLVDRWLSCSRN